MTIPSQDCPPRFQRHRYRHAFEIEGAWRAVWNWLMTPDTFTKGQPWPYRVEFLETSGPEGGVARGFEVGALNAHHGPFMNFCGVVSRVEVLDDRAERDIEYAYGAYFLAFRLVRPVGLRVSVDGISESRCRVEVQVDSYVRPWTAGLWTLAQRCFWPGFGLSLRRAGRRTLIPTGG
ncbi:MAG: hypothetical protein CMJ52_03820 [Planctomycetaceae bacterium]|nr:hypothetical protein [Planctomycetaceae bacterium]